MVYRKTQLHRRKKHDQRYIAFHKLATIKLWVDVKAERIVVGKRLKPGASGRLEIHKKEQKNKGKKSSGKSKNEGKYQGMIALSLEDEKEKNNGMNVEDLIMHHVAAFDLIVNKKLKIAKDELQVAKKWHDEKRQTFYQAL